MPTIPKGDDDELKGTNPDVLVPSQGPKNEGTLKGQPEIPITLQDPSIKEPQDPQDEEDLPIILHAENIGRKNGKHAPSSSRS
jgi:hypothetical protein